MSMNFHDSYGPLLIGDFRGLLRTSIGLISVDF